MPNTRRLMRQVREILRLKYGQGLRHRAIARACGVGLGTVSEYCRRAEQGGLTWPLPDDLDDAQLEARLFQRVHDLVGVPRPRPDMAWIHQELTRPGATLQRLWLEFFEAHPDTYRYSQFRRRSVPFGAGPLWRWLAVRHMLTFDTGLTRASHRVQGLWRVLGWRLPWTAVLWLLRPKYLVLVRDLALPLPSVLASALTAWATWESHFDALGAVDPAMTRAEIRRRLSDGQVCYLGWVGASLAYYRWETTEPTSPYLGKWARPLPGRLHIQEVLTASGFRRRGVHSAGAIQSAAVGTSARAAAEHYARHLGGIPRPGGWPGTRPGIRREGRSGIGISGRGGGTSPMGPRDSIRRPAIASKPDAARVRQSPRRRGGRRARARSPASRVAPAAILPPPGARPLAGRRSARRRGEGRAGLLGLLVHHPGHGLHHAPDVPGEVRPSTRNPR